MKSAVRIANGEERLEPRPPTDASAVLSAERILGADPRPIYAFVGNLHPDLGSVGLILSRAWSTRTVQGATRCDSGGLYGRRGGFGCLSPEEAERALLALSTPQTCTSRNWESHFADEIASGYAGSVASYVAGDEPSLDHLGDDVRARCVRHAHEQGMTIDRRLWTWELRLHDAPAPGEMIAVILSQEAFKRLESLSEAGEITVTEQVSILYGEAASHWFDAPAIREVLQGGP